MSAVPKTKHLFQVELEVLSGPGKGLKQSFLQESIIIGRGVDVQFILGEDPKVSRQHIEILQTKLGLRVVNLSKSNPSILDGLNFVEKEINKVSILKIGESEIQISADFPALVVNELLVPVEPEGFDKKSQVSNVPNVISMQAPVNSGLQSPSRPANNFGIAQNNRAQFLKSDAYVTPNYQEISGTSEQKNKKIKFYIIVVGVLVIAAYLSSQKEKQKKSGDLYRGADKIEMDLAESQKSVEIYKEKKEKNSSIQSRRALENFTQGFRDYRAGQYARAIESFQVVKNLDPGNELAERYYKLSKIKHDEEIKFIMLQGHANRDKKNFRMCISNFKNVLNMLGNDKNSATYKEAKQFFDECTLAIEGRF